MKPKTRRLILAGLLAAVIGGVAAAGYVWWRAGQRAAAVVAALPAAPDVSSWPAEFGHRLESCYRRARVGPDPSGALAELSRLLHANGFLAEAAQCYDTLTILDPGEARWTHRLATIHAGYGHADAALELWQQTVARAPHYLPARLRRADVLLKENRIDEATRAYEEILERHPDEPYAQLGLARCDLEAERWVQARERLERLVAQTNYQLGYDLIVSVYERLGQQERAAAVRGQMLASGAYRDFPDPWMEELFEDCYDLYQLSLTAGAAERAGDATTAVRRLERALRLDPNSHSVHFQLGLTYQALKDTNKARAHLERSTVLDPTFSDAWAHLSSLHAVAGDQSTAQRVLAEGLRHNPGSHGLRLMRARALKDAGRMREAIRDYQLAIETRSNSADPYIELAMTYFRVDAVEEGLAELQKALVAEPEHPTALTTLAMHAISVGDEAAARHWLRRAQAQPRVRPDILRNLLRSYQEKFGRSL